MRDTWGEVATAVVCACAGLILGVITTDKISDSHWEKQAIKRGYAQYHPTTGEWGWIEKPEQEAAK